MELANKIKKEKEEEALEKAREEKRKELANKNVTVDIKGELVYIKSLDVNQFINDFTKSKSKYKEIKTIEFESKSKGAKRRMSAVVEKNIELNNEAQEQEKVQKKKQKNKNTLNFIKKTDEKNMPNKGHGAKEIDFIIEKSKEPINIAGSNFDLMNPVCGVNFTEDKKTKSGGKDFFHRYNKYSLQLFEETLNKTISANFYRNKIENTINNTISNNVMSLKKRRKTIRDLIDSSNKDKEKKNISKINANSEAIIIPNESNDKISVKIKNLKLALNNLDLISEGEEKYLSKKIHKTKNVIKKKQFIMDFQKKELKDFNEINKFAKTLVGTENWGDQIYSKSNIKKGFRLPKKPIFDELRREVPTNVLKHLPRKRLPPINAINRSKEIKFGKTMDNFNIKPKNILKPLSTEENKNILIDAEEGNNNNMLDLKNDNNLSSLTNFYKNNII